MIRSKLAKYNEIKEMPNVLECLLNRPEGELSAYWDDLSFEDKPLFLELGCGRGEFTTALAAENKKACFIGIDIKGSRLWYGAKAAVSEGLDNVFFIRMQIDHIDMLFPPNSVDGIWLPFPDPHSKNPGKSAKRRLVSPVFLSKYRRIVKENAKLRLKTDDSGLYRYALSAIHSTGGKTLCALENLYDLQNDFPFAEEARRIQTAFERRYLRRGLAVKYIEFTL